MQKVNGSQYKDLKGSHPINVWQHLPVLKVSLLLFTFVFHLQTVGGNLELVDFEFLLMHCMI